MKCFLFLLIACLLKFGFINNTYGQTISTTPEIIIQDPEIEKLFNEFKYRFHQLFNNQYLRGNINPKSTWIVEIEQLNIKSQGRLLRAKNVSFDELRNLALAFVASKGEETEYITDTRKKIEKIIAPTDIENKELALIYDTSSIHIDYDNLNIDDEIDKVIQRSKLIHKLLIKHYSLRETLKPFATEMCQQYWKLISLKESKFKPKIDSVINALISKDKTQNAYFLNEIISQKYDTTLVTIKRAIAPVFNLKADSVGIYNGSCGNIADEKLLRKTNYYNEIDLQAVAMGKNSNTSLYKEVIENLKPIEIFIYSTTDRFESKVLRFGKFTNECLEYFYYECEADTFLKTQKNLLFASKFNLELEYINNHNVDALINREYVGICFDCPSNWDAQKTFARLKGYENVYFSYVLENELDNDNNFTPMRALHYVKDNLVIRLWGSDIDLFGCSCL